MKTNLKTFCVVTMVTFLMPFYTKAALLETWHTSMGSCGSLGNISEVEVEVSIQYREPGIFTEHDPFIFNHVPISMDDIGTTLIASSITSPDFDLFTNLLTNGVNDTLNLELFGCGGGEPDSNWLIAKGDVLKAYKIDHYGLTINSLTIVTFQTSNGFWTDVSGDFTFNVYGTIPEPATLSLLALGVVLVRRKITS
jgi:hypothetical protein